MYISRCLPLTETDTCRSLNFEIVSCWSHIETDKRRSLILETDFRQSLTLVTTNWLSLTATDEYRSLNSETASFQSQIETDILSGR